MARLPRTECPVCTRNVAVTVRGLVYRHDPASGRSPDLRSCPGSLKPVQAPEGALLLFVDVDQVVPEDPAQPVPALF